MRKDIKAPNSYFTGNIGELSTNLIYQRNHIVCTSLGKSDFGEDLFCDIFSGSKDCNTYRDILEGQKKDCQYHCQLVY